MNKENAIEVKNIKKSFRVYQDRSGSLKDRLLTKGRSRYENREVLKDISFSVKKGEALGLIGHNGCGKSTTLKLLTKIMYPDSGTIEMDGRVASLIELGAGFHPDMSGRENIYINAAIFGLTKKEIDARLSDIIAFSELEEFIDNPVRTYSSGMYMRLAFSVAINVDAEILLIDEILAVGDIAFQAKCFNRLKEIKERGTTIVIVSHNLGQIESICERTIWLHNGYIKKEGSPLTVHPQYVNFMNGRSGDSVSDYLDGTNSSSGHSGFGGGRYKSVKILDANGNEKERFSNSEEITICLEYETDGGIPECVAGVAIWGDDGTHLYGVNTLLDFGKSMCFGKEGSVQLVFKSLPLNSGKYYFDFSMHRLDGECYDYWKQACRISIVNDCSEQGILSIPHDWIIR